MQTFKHIICGFILGIANIIPGISGSTVAVILNIYDKILYALSFKNFLKNWNFLLSLTFGAVCGIFIFSKLVSYLYEHHSGILNYGFIGLIIGSLPMIYTKARQEKLQQKNWFPFILSFLFMIALSILKYISETTGTGSAVGDSVSTLPVSIRLSWIFIACFISIIAMLLPGISGAFILVLLGCYAPVLVAISTFDFSVLTAASLGMLLGGFVGVKIIKIMLREHPQALYMAILGLIVGSIFGLLPPFNNIFPDFYAIALMFLCGLLSFKFSQKV